MGRKRSYEEKARMILSQESEYKLMIDKMLGYVEKILKDCANLSFEEFAPNEILVETCASGMIRIGEYALKLEHLDIAWKSVYELHNQIVCDCEGINSRLAWEIIEKGLPELQSYLVELNSRSKVSRMTDNKIGEIYENQERYKYKGFLRYTSLVDTVKKIYTNGKISSMEYRILIQEIFSYAVEALNPCTISACLEDEEFATECSLSGYCKERLISAVKETGNSDLISMIGEREVNFERF